MLNTGNENERNSGIFLKQTKIIKIQKFETTIQNNNKNFKKNIDQQKFWKSEQETN